MRIRPGVLKGSACGFLLLLPVAGIAEGESAQPSECEYCQFDLDANVGLDIGAWWDSDDEWRFADFSGLDDDGFHPLLGADYFSRNADGRYLIVAGHELGLDRRQLSVEIGRQGVYDIFVGYRKIPHYRNSSGATPFNLADSTLSLPTTWVSSGATSTMPLASALAPLELGGTRHLSNAAINALFPDNWEFGASFQNENREGTRLTGGSFLTNGTLLPTPDDFTTDSVDAFAAWANKELRVTLRYYGSFFRNDYAAMRWQNPFTSLAPGADAGQLALAPDNDFHQLSLGWVYRVSNDTRINAAIGKGRGRQNDPFLPSTVNAVLNTAPLPVAALDGQVDTSNGQLRFYSRLSDALSMQFNTRYSRRTNKTEQHTFEQVVTDVYIGGLRTNVPYSHERTEHTLDFHYRTVGPLGIRAGIGRKDMERDYQEVSETRTDSIWTELRFEPTSWSSMQLRLRDSTRDGSRAVNAVDILDGEDAALRRFHLANVNREQAGISVTLVPSDWIGINLSTDYQDETYPDSGIGLLQSRNRIHSASADFGFMPELNMAVFLSSEDLDSSQAGRENPGGLGWFAFNNDETFTAGLSMNYARRGSPWRWRAYAAHSDFSGRTIVEAVTDMQPFPDLTAKLLRAELNASYDYSETLTIKLGLIHESYSATDWQIDGVADDTITSFLTTGMTSPDYTVSALAVSVYMRF